MARARGPAAFWLHSPPLLRLLGATASNGLLTGQIVFSTAFVGACELPNWIQEPRISDHMITMDGYGVCPL